MQLLDVHEQVRGRADLGRGAGERAHRVDQVGRAVVCAALVAAVAVLVGRLAVGAGALDEAVGQERAGHGVVELRRPPSRSTRPAWRRAAQISSQSCAVLGAVGAAVVVELDVEAGEVAPGGPAASGRSAPPRAMPSCRARIMIAVPCVSSAQM